MLLCAPYFSSVVLAAERDPQRRHRRREAGAAARASRAATRSRRSRSPSRPASGTRPASRWRRRENVGGEFTLVGEKMFVIDGHTADLDRRRRPHRGHDRHRRHLVLHGRRRRRRSDPHAALDDGHDAQAGEARVRQRRGRRRSAAPGRGLAAFSKTLDQAAVALSNEMMGGAQKVLEMSVEYAKVRVQFGRPIGSFQAIKHKCADMLLEVESGKSAAYYASWAAAEDNDELPVVAALVEGVLLRGVLPRRGREHPDPRRHRLHVGAPRAPLLQARQELRDLPRRPDVPPRAARPAHRHLSRELASDRVAF